MLMIYNLPLLLQTGSSWELCTENTEPTLTQLAPNYSVAIDDAAGYLRNVSSLRAECFIYKSQTLEAW